MIYGYIRVSTDKQTTENQEFEIRKFCEKENIQVDIWVKETISSTKDLNKRKLKELLEQKISKSAIARILGVHRITVAKFIRERL